LKSLYTFPDWSGQVPKGSGQDVLAVFEQQFIPALAIRQPLVVILKKKTNDKKNTFFNSNFHSFILLHESLF
jgi:hypothetical protein